MGMLWWCSRVILLRRRRWYRGQKPIAYVAWQGEEDGPWVEYIEGAYGVVNLAGGSIYTWGSRQTRESISTETQNRVCAILESRSSNAGESFNVSAHHLSC